MLETIEKYWWSEGHFNFDQRDYFIETLGKLNPKNVLEIGFASGRSCVTALVAAQPDQMVSVELNLDSVQPSARQHSQLLEKDFPNLKIIEGNSATVLNEQFFNSYFADGVDFAFVDGGHSYQDAKTDCDNVYPHLNQGGMMVVDDYMSGPPNGCELLSVTTAVNDFAKENNLSPTVWNVKGKGFAIFTKNND